MHLGRQAGRWRWYSPKSKGRVNTEVENANIAEYEIFIFWLSLISLILAYQKNFDNTVSLKCKAMVVINIKRGTAVQLSQE